MRKARPLSAGVSREQRPVATPCRNLIGAGGSRGGSQAGDRDASRNSALSLSPVRDASFSLLADESPQVGPTLPPGTWGAGAFERGVADRAGPGAPAAQRHAVPVPQLVARSLADAACERLFGPSYDAVCGCAERGRASVAAAPPATGGGGRRGLAAGQEVAFVPQEAGHRRQDAWEPEPAAATPAGIVAMVGRTPRAARRSVGEIRVPAELATRSRSVGLDMGDLDPCVPGDGGSADVLEAIRNGTEGDPVPVDESVQMPRAAPDSASSSPVGAPWMFCCSPERPAAEVEYEAADDVEPVVLVRSLPATIAMDIPLTPRCSDGSAAQVQVVGCPGDEGVSYCTSVGSLDRSAFSNSAVDSSTMMGDSIDEGCIQGKDLPRPSVIIAVSRLPSPGSRFEAWPSAGRAFNSSSSKGSEHIPCGSGRCIPPSQLGARPADSREDDVIDLNGWAARAVAKALAEDRSLSQPHAYAALPPSAAARKVSPGAVSTLGVAAPTSGGSVQVPSARRGVYFPPPPVHAHTRVYHRGHLAEWTPQGELATPCAAEPPEPTPEKRSLAGPRRTMVEPPEPTLEKRSLAGPRRTMVWL